MVGPLQKTVVVVSKHTNRGEEQKLISPGVVVGWGGVGWGEGRAVCVCARERKTAADGLCLKGLAGHAWEVQNSPIRKKERWDRPGPTPGRKPLSPWDVPTR